MIQPNSEARGKPNIGEQEALSATNKKALQQLQAFCKFLDNHPALAESVKAAQNADAIVELAAAQGCAFSAYTLRQHSRELSSSYWPWAGKGRDVRRSFFGTKG